MAKSLTDPRNIFFNIFSQFLIPVFILIKSIAKQNKNIIKRLFYAGIFKLNGLLQLDTHSPNRNNPTNSGASNAKKSIRKIKLIKIKLFLYL